MSYKIYKNCISKSLSDSLFNYVLKVCNFYSPKIFNLKRQYPKKWTDPKFISEMTKLRENKKAFSSLYDTVQISNELQKIPFKSNMETIASKFLKIKKENLSIRGIIGFRMDFPNDTRNSYGWHQDSAYDRYNIKSNNGVVLWIPLINANKENGTIVIKPGSENRSFNCSKRIFSGDKYKSEQIIVMNKYLKKYPSKSVDVKKNDGLATYCGIFHKSGVNLSNQIRFTLIVKYNNQLSKDFLFYRRLKN